MESTVHSQTSLSKYLGLVKFSHTIFAMPFAFIGFCMALGHHYPFRLKILFLMLACMVCARNAAMAFNRYLDREFDARNPRTAGREIPAGSITPRSALIFTIVNCAFFIIATWFINIRCFILSPVALFVVLFYSYTKRFTPLCHLVLGCGLALAPIGAYLTLSNAFALLPVLVSILVLTWVSGFDIIYALQDEEFDRSEQLHSIPQALGRKRALTVSVLLHIVTAIMIILIGVTGNFHWIYWIGAFLMIGLLSYQHSIVKPDDLSKVNVAFGTTNGLASIIFAVFSIVAIFLK